MKATGSSTANVKSWEQWAKDLNLILMNLHKALRTYGDDDGWLKQLRGHYSAYKDRIWFAVENSRLHVIFSEKLTRQGCTSCGAFPHRGTMFMADKVTVILDGGWHVVLKDRTR